MASENARTVRAGGRAVTVRRPDKVLFPEDGWTKADLVDYHRAVAPFMLPQLRGRPLMLERCPDGVSGPRFMQKDTPDHYPGWIERVTVAKEGGTVTHTVCDNAATLVFLADQACVTLHRWQSRERDVDRPDRLVFDLDPPDAEFEPVREAALLLHDFFDELRLPSAAMTTGSRGLHVIVPLDGRAGFDEVRDFAHEVAQALADAHPRTLTTAIRKKDRDGRLYLDVQRNAYAQTSVTPWTVRAKRGAPVAAPLSWDQVADPAVTARRWTLENAVEHARTKPWADLPLRGRALGPARRRLHARRD
ncbi:non-homologous end-joining DNA ligase [Streptomyces sp. TS71-3]|uniref:non-homologous end-joining DNA ligase n=1 Tax=Streptomyces sp. TS71-3 TaxID=2733862 RepID=UPI001B007F7F|nr:non-homologous end-joining DNA ligase [Streptomyces sp. TS71-3]GHJ41424.1 ATP-dependent DNA ligase [Streptomyces sp. TS71-3]